MDAEMLTSIGLLVAIALAAFLCVRLVGKRLKSTTTFYVFAGTLWVMAIVGTWFIDANIPLHRSHYRPGAEAAPVWLAVLAFFVRFAAFASMFVAVARHRKVAAAN